jgi:putative ABC transport system substrate-binding protein
MRSRHDQGLRTHVRGILVAFALGILALAAITEAQPPKPGKLVRIGRLSPLSLAADRPSLAAFREGMRALGWVDGKDFTLEARFADGRADRLSGLAADFVRAGVDLILVGSNPGALAAKRATTTVPIVMVTTGDPVAAGIVPSLAHPGGNLTGITALGQVLTAKRLELIKETVPGVTRVVVVARTGGAYTADFLGDRERLARTLGLELPVAQAGDTDELDKALRGIAVDRTALMVLTDPLFIAQHRRIVEIVGRTRLPAIYPERQFVDAGGLMFYGASLVHMYREAAVHADKILRGARPGELPIEQPTTLELAINVKTARAIGLTIPAPVLARADHIVQ